LAEEDSEEHRFISWYGRLDRVEGQEAVEGAKDIQ